MLKKFLCKGYLDNSATTRFKPISVPINMFFSTIKSANMGRSAHKDALKAMLKFEECRDYLASYVGKKYLYFTKNCTEALNSVIFSIKKNSTVLTTCFEHNSVLRPLKKLETDGKIKLIIVEPKKLKVSVSDIIPYIDKIDVLVMQEMNNVTGEKHDIQNIAKLCNEHNVLTMLDTAQSLGHVMPNYQNVSFVLASGHKGLHGPEGTGFVATDNIEYISPLLYGGTGTDSNNLNMPLSFPESMEAGTQSLQNIIGLYHGAKWTIKHQEAITDKIKKLSASYYQELNKLKNIRIYSPDNGSGIISFSVINHSSSEVADILSNNNISVRGGLHCAPLLHKYLCTSKSGLIRISLDATNGYSEIKTIKKVINDLR